MDSPTCVEKQFMSSKKQIAIILLTGAFSLGLFACTNSPQTAQNQNVNKPAQNATNSLVTSSHSTDKPVPSNSTNSGAPSSPSSASMGEAVDVSEQTANIEKAEKAYKSKSTDGKLKSDLAAAYFKRAFDLTGARQYRSALGDFRKGLKLNPNDEDAKAMHDQIIKIFKDMGREPPKEGEEPPPLSLNK